MINSKWIQVQNIILLWRIKNTITFLLWKIKKNKVTLCGYFWGACFWVLGIHPHFLFDLSIAFNTIDHGVLLDQLQELGMGARVLCGFAPVFRVTTSRWQLSGRKPQGSVLFPFFFNIFIKRLGDLIHHYRQGMINMLTIPNYTSLFLAN